MKSKFAKANWGILGPSLEEVLETIEIYMKQRNMEPKISKAVVEKGKRSFKIKIPLKKQK